MANLNNGGLPYYHQPEQLPFVRTRHPNGGRPQRDAEQGTIDCVTAANKYGGILVCEQRAPRNHH